MQILALDLSFKATGVAYGAADAPPHSLTIEAAGGARARSAARLWSALRDHLVAHPAELIVMESPLVTSNRGSAATTRIQCGIAMLVEACGELRGIPVREVAVSSWRKMFLGTGRPARPKEEAEAMCRLLGWNYGDSHDRAEAMGIWAWAQFTYGDRAAIVRLLSNASMLKLRGQDDTHTPSRRR